MRDDMHKVICERERPGSRAYNPKGDYDSRFRNRDAEDKFDQLDSLPRFESMTKRLGYEKRPFNENLEPLRRFLEKQCGRPWNKVKAEMLKIVGKESVIHRHVWQHVEGFVSENIVEVDGKLYERHDGGFSFRRRDSIQGTNLTLLKKGEGYVYLYVHPRTGILKKNKEYRSGGYFGGYAAHHAKKLADRMRKTDDPMVQLHKLAGIWYRVELMKATSLLVDPLAKYYQGEKEGWGYMSARTFYDMDAVMAVGKTRRALSKKDLKHHGLSNDQAEAA